MTRYAALAIMRNLSRSCGKKEDEKRIYDAWKPKAAHVESRPLERGAVRHHVAIRIAKKCCCRRSVGGVHEMDRKPLSRYGLICSLLLLAYPKAWNGDKPPPTAARPKRTTVGLVARSERKDEVAACVPLKAKRSNARKAPNEQTVMSRPARRKSGQRDQIRLLIADDHALILEGLAATISRQEDMTVVAKARDGREAVELWKKHRPDVALLDLRMPQLNGVGAIREIRDLDVAARIIVQTTYDTDEEIYQAVRAGAKAYLLKDAPLEELLNVIRRVHGGGTCIPPALAAKLASRMSGEALTRREVDVLKLLARGKSNKEIGSDLFIGETTVKTHVRSIFAKLNVLSRTEAIGAANRRGLIQL
jgi:two-component system NarL family response regulator